MGDKRKEKGIKFKEAIEKFFPDPSHPCYSRWTEYSFGRFDEGIQITKDIAGVISLEGKKVLDVGTGVGGISAAMALAGATPYAIDIDDDFIGIAKALFEDHNLEVHVLKCDGQEMCFKNDVFDVILAIDILEHACSPEQLVQEISRVLKPGGYCLLHTGYKYSIGNILSDPHYELPFVILFPRRVRRFIVVNVMKRSKRLDDYYWFSSFKEVQKLLKKNNIEIHPLIKEDRESQIKERMDNPNLLRSTVNRRLIEVIKLLHLDKFILRLYSRKIIESGLLIGKKDVV